MTVSSAGSEHSQVETIIPPKDAVTGIFPLKASGI